MHRSVFLVGVAAFGLVSGCSPSTAPTAPSVSPRSEAAPVAASGLVNEAREVAVAADGAVWVATGGGVVRWQTPTGPPTVFVESDGLPSRTVAFVAASEDGSVWAAGDRWVARYDGSWAVTGRDSIPDGDMGDLAVGPDGNAWIAVGGDLLRLAGNTWAAVDPPPVQGASPWTGSLAVAPDGAVWASPNGGEGDSAEVLTYDGRWTEYTESDGLAGRTSTVAVSGDGTVWVGGEGLFTMTGEVLSPPSGVSRLAQGRWTVFTTQDGLVADDADVVVRSDGTVWAVSSEVDPKGISRFDGSSWTAFPDLGGRGRGAAVGADGTLWMPSDAGVIGFDGTDTTRLAVSPEQAPPPEALPGFTLTAATDVNPLRTNTSIGNLEWTTYEFPPGEEMYLALGTAHGPVAVPMGGSRLNWSTDNVTWAGTTTSIEPWRLTRAGDDVVIFDGGAARYTWDGAAWVKAARLDVQDASRMVFGPRGAVAADGSGAGLTYYFAPDSVHFAEATSGPSKDAVTSTDSRCNSLGSGPGDTPGPLLATSTGFVALTASNPEKWNEISTCSPVVWTSPDGDAWTLVSGESPFGAGSTVDYVAQRDGRFVATGTFAARPSLANGNAAVWTSSDGITWRPADLDVGNAQGLTVSSGALGWVVTGATFTTQPLTDLMWTSPDGVVWDGPYPLPTGFGTGYLPLQLAIGTDSIFGIGGRSQIPVVARIVE
jgi:hypothetical protein